MERHPGAGSAFGAPALTCNRSMMVLGSCCRQGLLRAAPESPSLLSRGCGLQEGLAWAPLLGGRAQAKAPNLKIPTAPGGSTRQGQRIWNGQQGVSMVTMQAQRGDIGICSQAQGMWL